MLATTAKVIRRIKEIENSTDEKDLRYDGEIAKVLGCSRQVLANHRGKGSLWIKKQYIHQRINS